MERALIHLGELASAAAFGLDGSSHHKHTIQNRTSMRTRVSGIRAVNLPDPLRRPGGNNGVLVQTTATLDQRWFDKTLLFFSIDFDQSCNLNIPNCNHVCMVCVCVCVCVRSCCVCEEFTVPVQAKYKIAWIFEATTKASVSQLSACTVFPHNNLKSLVKQRLELLHRG